MAADPRVALAKAAGAAWAGYASTVSMGGTPLQRGWAFRQALKAEMKLLRTEWALNPPKPVPRPAPSLPLR